QVFSNLVDNAVKYRDPARPLRIHISAESHDGFVAYHVADNGVGIAAEHQQKIFEICHRVSPGSADGEGLGLTIARRIVDRLNGRLAVDSTPGTGSVFTVYVPSAERDIQTIAQ